jgi:putative mRNA 3-end processing factor
MPSAAVLLQPRPEGLYVPTADLYVDPVRPVARALITHGHSDHARAGHGAVLATPQTLAIMRARFGAEFAARTQPLPYGETLRLDSVDIRLAPAGHILGSAQASFKAHGVHAVVSGDYKRQADPTCAPFEPMACDLFVTEATFALPVFRHPDAAGQVRKLIASAQMFPDRAHLVGAYALGKAQRVMALLRACGWERPIYLHGALVALTEVYRAHGADFGEVRAVGEAKGADFAGEIVLCPPLALETPWLRRFPDPVKAFASGWMRIRARARQRGVELPLVISDHADWCDLQQTITQVAGGEVWITHGEAEALTHWCAGQGIDARALHLVGYGDEDADASAAP